MERDALESGYEAFKIGALIHDTRLEMGMTQEELAEKVGTTKSYISKIENNLKEVRISTLQKIIELGFGEEDGVFFSGLSCDLVRRQWHAVVAR